jgi:bacterioferritin-associated ferredoxin
MQKLSCCNALGRIVSDRRVSTRRDGQRELRREKMIVCSCNVLSDNDVRACLNPGPGCPRTPAQVYQCLGCSPDCGRCARTLRSIISDALGVVDQAPSCQRDRCSASHMAEALEAAIEA